MRDIVRSSLRVGLVVLVVAALAMGGLALAQTGDDDPAESPATEEPEQRGPRFVRGGHLGKGLIGAAAEVLGLEPSDIVDQLRGGSTLAEIAAANGSTTDAIVAAAVANLSERLDEAVADERLTREEADEKLADAEERLTERAESDEPFEFRGRGHGFGKRGFRLGPDVLTETLGMTPQELREALGAGQTLAEIAEAQGVSTDDLVAALTSRITEKLDEAVADGKLTQEEADEKLADIEERTRTAVEEGLSFRPRGDFGGRRGFGPRGGGFGGFGPPTGEEAVSA